MPTTSAASVSRMEAPGVGPEAAAPPRPWRARLLDAFYASPLYRLMLGNSAVSYTHLTLPTNREV